MLLSDKKLAAARDLRRKWPADYPPIVDDLLNHIDELAAALAAERKIADDLAAAMLWYRTDSPSLAAYRAARPEATDEAAI
jgi:hypothetical protein